MQKYLAAAVLILLIIFLFQKINWLPSFKNFFKSQPVIIEETPVLINEINALSQLVTITYADEVVMDTAKQAIGIPSLISAGTGMMLIPSNDRLVIIGRGKVIAGIDFKALQQKDVIVTGDSVRLILPKAQILSAIVNPSGFETFEEEGDWDEQAVIALKVKIKNEIIKRALQQDIISQAQQRSINIIETFLKTTGFNKVNVSITHQSP